MSLDSAVEAGLLRLACSLRQRVRPCPHHALAVLRDDLHQTDDVRVELTEFLGWDPILQVGPTTT